MATKAKAPTVPTKPVSVSLNHGEGNYMSLDEITLLSYEKGSGVLTIAVDGMTVTIEADGDKTFDLTVAN